MPLFENAEAKFWRLCLNPVKQFHGYFYFRTNENKAYDTAYVLKDNHNVLHTRMTTFTI